jgi:hypothetical protein
MASTVKNALVWTTSEKRVYQFTAFCNYFIAILLLSCNSWLIFGFKLRPAIYHTSATCTEFSKDSSRHAWRLAAAERGWDSWGGKNVWSLQWAGRAPEIGQIISRAPSSASLLLSLFES